MMKKIRYASLIAIAAIAVGCSTSPSAVPQGWKWGENVTPAPPPPTKFTLSDNPSAVPPGWKWGETSQSTAAQATGTASVAPIAPLASSAPVAASPSSMPAAPAPAASNGIAMTAPVVASNSTPMTAAPAESSMASAPATSSGRSVFYTSGCAISVATPSEGCQVPANTVNGHPPIMSETVMPATAASLPYVQQVGPVQLSDAGMVYMGGAMIYPGWSEFH